MFAVLLGMIIPFAAFSCVVLRNGIDGMEAHPFAPLDPSDSGGIGSSAALSVGTRPSAAEGMFGQASAGISVSRFTERSGLLAEAGIGGYAGFRRFDQEFRDAYPDLGLSESYPYYGLTGSLFLEAGTGRNEDGFSWLGGLYARAGYEAGSYFLARGLLAEYGDETNLPIIVNADPRRFSWKAGIVPFDFNFRLFQRKFRTRLCAGISDDFAEFMGSADWASMTFGESLDTAFSSLIVYTELHGSISMDLPVEGLYLHASAALPPGVDSSISLYPDIAFSAGIGFEF